MEDWGTNHDRVGARVYDIKEGRGEAGLHDPTHPSRPTARAGPGRRSCPQVGAHHSFSQARSEVEYRLADAIGMVEIARWIACMSLLRNPEDVQSCVARGGGVVGHSAWVVGWHASRAHL